MGFLHTYNKNRTTLIYGDDQDGSVFFMEVKKEMVMGNHVRQNHLQYGLTAIGASTTSETCWAGFADGALLQFDGYGLQGRVKLPHSDDTPVRAIGPDCGAICWADGRVLARLERQSRLPKGCVSCACFVGHDCLLITGHEDGQVVLWDYEVSKEILAFPGHMSRTEQIEAINMSKLAVSRGRDDLHVGIWSWDSDERHTSLPTEAGPVEHFDLFEDKLALLTRQHCVVLYNQIASKEPKLERRILLAEPAAGILIFEDLHIWVVEGSHNSMCLRTVDQAKDAGNALALKAPSIGESAADIVRPLLPPKHQVRLPITLKIQSGAPKAAGTSADANRFVGALRSADHQTVSHMLTDRSPDEIREILLPLTDDIYLQSSLIEHISCRLAANSEFGLKVLSWIRIIAEIFDTKATEGLSTLIKYRCSLLQDFYHLKLAMNSVNDSCFLELPTETDPAKKAPIFQDQ